MSNLKKSSTRRSDDTMDDDSDDKDSKRKSRNLSEKKRRDQFNLLVNELSSMVATSGKKMDKSTVLKSTISFLRNHNEITVRSRVNEIQEDWKPTFLTNEEFTHLVLEAVDGFIMVFSATGQIFYASESISSLLGHLPNEVLSMTIYEMASEEEHNSLYNVLYSPSEEEGHVSFSCHLRRGESQSKSLPCYELVHFVGYFRSDEDMVQGENRYSGYSGEADTRLVFVGTGRIQTPQLIREMPLVDSSKSEFTSRHSLEWKFLFLDHRAPPIIGYLPFELLGTSGYDYYHVDDLDSVISSHEALMLKGEGTSCFYRFLTKGQQWIWLQTRFYITYHQWNSKPEFIVCTHRVVSYRDVMKQTSNKDSNVPTPGNVSPMENSRSSSLQWTHKNSKSSIRFGGASDCTSMSADSATSRNSSMAHHTVKSKSNHGKPVNQVVPQQQQQQQPQPQLATVQPLIQQQPQRPVHTAQQFLEPPPAQYVATIPVQTVLPTFSPSAVLSPLQQLDHVLMTPAQTQIHIDLQRKQAELQAIIGQQQMELRRVSEQLYLARCELLQQTQTQPVQNFYVQVPPGGTTAMSTYPQQSPQQQPSSATVSSTTTTVQPVQCIQQVSDSTGETSSAVIQVPVSISLSVPVQVQTQHQHQQQQTLLYNPPDSNGQQK